MPTKNASAVSVSHRAIGETPTRMLKANLPKGETCELLKEIGECLDFARRAVGWTVDQLAREIGRDSKQVARWMRGEERTQIDAVFAVEVLRQPFVIALARLSECFEEEITLKARKRA